METICHFPAEAIRLLSSLPPASGSSVEGCPGESWGGSTRNQSFWDMPVKEMEK